MTEGLEVQVRKGAAVLLRHLEDSASQVAPSRPEAAVLSAAVSLRCSVPARTPAWLLPPAVLEPVQLLAAGRWAARKTSCGAPEAASQQGRAGAAEVLWPGSGGGCPPRAAR